MRNSFRRWWQEAAAACAEAEAAAVTAQAQADPPAAQAEALAAASQAEAVSSSSCAEAASSSSAAAQLREPAGSEEEDPGAPAHVSSGRGVGSPLSALCFGVLACAIRFPPPPVRSRTLAMRARFLRYPCKLAAGGSNDGKFKCFTQSSYCCSRETLQIADPCKMARACVTCMCASVWRAPARVRMHTAYWWRRRMIYGLAALSTG